MSYIYQFMYSNFFVVMHNLDLNAWNNDVTVVRRELWKKAPLINKNKVLNIFLYI